MGPNLVWNEVQNRRPNIARVAMLLSDEEWSKRSDRWIAEKCGVSDRFVNGLRKSTANASQLERTGQDGKTRKLPERKQKPEQPPASERRPSARSWNGIARLQTFCRGEAERGCRCVVHPLYIGVRYGYAEADRIQTRR